MTADIVNLRQARKRKARAQETQRAAERRILFGRSKAEKAGAAAQADAETRHLDSHRRQRPTETRE